MVEALLEPQQKTVNFRVGPLEVLIASTLNKFAQRSVCAIKFFI